MKPVLALLAALCHALHNGAPWCGDITLVAHICHNVSGAELCLDEPVPTLDKDGNYMMAAGKVDDQIPLQYTRQMCVIHAWSDALDWLSHSQEYSTWQLRGTKCAPGKYVEAKKT